MRALSRSENPTGPGEKGRATSQKGRALSQPYYPPPPPPYVYQPLPVTRRPRGCSRLAIIITVITVLTLGVTLFACLFSMLIFRQTVTPPQIDLTVPPQKNYIPGFSAPYKVMGKPTVTVDFINSVLAEYESPTSGKGQSLYDYGIKYGVNPAYALAFFLQESTFGKQGVAAVTRSLGNIRATAGHQEYHGYRVYKTWEEGFEDWYRLIAHTYVAKWGLKTVDQIIPVYAPSSDNNNVTLYISTVKQAVDKWNQGWIEV